MAMDCLVQELEDMNILEDDSPCWEKWIAFVCRLWVPERAVGLDRPCEEKDYCDYRLSLNKDMLNILTRLRILIENRDSKKIEIDHEQESVKNFIVCLVVLIGEQNVKDVWNTDETVTLAKDLIFEVCRLCQCEYLSTVLTLYDDKFLATLLAIRPKLLKETWKKYPAAVACYKWLLHQVDGLWLSTRVLQVLPTALIIFDDFVPENRVLGLECLYSILRDPRTRQELMKNGCLDVIYQALERLTRHRDVRFIIPVYGCLANVLETMEVWGNSAYNYEWTKRDEIILILLNNLEAEQNLELRSCYMLSLPQLMTNVGCAKWFDFLTRILIEYCDQHNDLKTLKATLQAAEAVLPLFTPRIPRHCASLYTAFIKLRCDLTETPVFDREINLLLERCIRMIYKITPDVGEAILQNDRVRSIMNRNLNFTCFDDKYCN